MPVVARHERAAAGGQWQQHVGDQPGHAVGEAVPAAVEVLEVHARRPELRGDLRRQRRLARGGAAVDRDDARKAGTRLARLKCRRDRGGLLGESRNHRGPASRNSLVIALVQSSGASRMPCSASQSA